MAVEIDLTCQRCDERIGTGAISVPLECDEDPFQLNLRPVIVDEKDLAYWRGIHTQKICDATIESKREGRHQRLVAQRRSSRA